MKYRRLGKAGFGVSEIGFGAWGIGGKWGPRDDAQALGALRRALDLGVNFIDTALAYGSGHSEKLVSRALGGSNQEVFVATKIPPKNHEWPARHHRTIKEVFSRDWVIQCTERSLKHLGRDWIDLQQLHVWAPGWHKEPEWLEALQRLKEQGKIRAVGVSVNDHEPDSALDLVRTGWVDALQVIYNIFDQTPGQNLFPLAQQQQVGIIARSPLDEGGLAGTLSHDTNFHPEDWRREYFRGNRLAETVQRASQLGFLVRGEIRSVAQAALKFCLSHPAVSTVIPGMRRISHVEDNCAVSDGQPLRDDELERLGNYRWTRNFYA